MGHIYKLNKATTTGYQGKTTIKIRNYLIKEHQSFIKVFLPS